MTKASIFESIGTCLALADTAMKTSDYMKWLAKADDWRAKLAKPLSLEDETRINEIRATKLAEYQSH